MTEITRLDDATVSKIAAGEVVERPASVVKELVENSLDADADRVAVAVEDGGRTQIRVQDDGRGMTEAGVKRAVEQHTTSKIASIEDLEAGVGTLGFRGEALHTIGAVSRMTVETRPREGADAGTELRVEGGDVVDLAPTGRAPGTTVTVRDLFFNTPARRKYLKQPGTEFGHVNRVVSRYALANPDVAVSLAHDGNEVFATAGQGDRREAVLAVYGREVAASMIDVDATPSGPVEAIAGLVSDPETTRSSAAYVSTFVNGRYVRERALRTAILDAYGKQLSADRYPFAVLFLEVPAGAVDVNVHPRKLAVRFDDEAGVTEALTGAVREALLDHGLLRTGAPRGVSAPDETAVNPGRSGPEAERDAGTAAGTDEEANGETDAREDPDAPGDPAADSGPGPARRGAGASEDVEPARHPASEDLHPSDEAGASPSRGPQSPAAPSAGEADRAAIDAAPRQLDLATAPRDAAETFDSLPRLRVLGQLDETYVLASSPDGLVVIDQHAADERVNYERLREQLRGDTTSQRLVDPVELPVTPGEAGRFEAVESIGEWGFEATLEGDRLRVEAVPAVFEETLSPDLLRDLLADALEDPAEALESAADAILADMACYPSITGNTSLTEGDVLDLLRALDDCENPYACPHGRPTIVEISIEELENRFERDYPGHGHRRL
ncbi:MAG: DNA mismatch repair endonuclease MutL [Halodesulfurarchaeum sp.]